MGSKISLSAVTRDNWTDDTCTNCEVCQVFFTIVIRRHHCRKCGSIVCGQCSTTKKMLADSVYCNTRVRICDKCKWSDRWLSKDIGNSVMQEALLIQQWEESTYIENQLRRSEAMTAICSSSLLLGHVCNYLTLADLCQLDTSISNEALRKILCNTYKSIELNSTAIQSSNQLAWISLKGMQVKWTCIACTYSNTCHVKFVLLVCEICETVTSVEALERVKNA